MRKISKKFALPAAAAGAVLAGGLSSAMADFVVTLSAPTVSGLNSIYVASIQNNGANGTGTQILGADITLTINAAQPAGTFFKMDNGQDLDGDSVPDVNISGNNITGMTTPTTPATRAFASSFGTWGRLGGNSIISDAHNGVQDTTSDYLSTKNGGHYNPVWNSLTSFELVEGSNITSGGSADSVATKFFNIVVPTGALFTLTGSAGGTTGSQSNFTTGNSPVGVTTYPIVVLRATAPTNTGNAITNGNGGTPTNPQGTFTPAGAATSTLTVSGGGGNYNPGFIYSLTAGTNAAFVKTAGFTGADTNIYLLNIKDTANGANPSSSDINTIIADINNAAAGNGIVASTVPANLVGLGGVVSAWDIEITETNPGLAQNGFFGFNFAGETNIAGVTVTDIAAVPEPATAGLLLVGGLGLLARRRRSSN